MKAEKQFLLDEIKEKIVNSKAMVLANYSGFKANMNAEFRDAIFKTGADFEVVRKRVFLKAAAEAGIEFSRKDLSGHLAVVFADTDPLQTAKALYKFTNDNKDVLDVLGGHFDGKNVSKDEVKQLSELPSMDEMRAQLVGLLQAPMQQTLGVMQAALTSVMFCLDGKVKKLENS